MRHSRKTGGVSGPRCLEGSAFWPNDGVTKHGAGGAALIGCVLSENTTMLQMCRDLGFKAEMGIADATTYRVTLALIEKIAPEPA